MRLMWETMREPILKSFPAAKGAIADKKAFLAQVEENYVTDAYHSLSIEGYQVSPALIENVRSGNWDTEFSGADRSHRDALAARGYWQAFKAVKKSLSRVLAGENAGRVAREDHSDWYREMFAPSVMAGLIQSSDLAGYRSDQVFIRRSMHVPPRKEAVRDMMPIFFQLLEGEKEAPIRIVLGHFMFGYIHPYMDGNGRMTRFLMNLMCCAGGFPWTVIPLSKRQEYMAALEEASVNQDILSFSTFIVGLAGETRIA